MRLNSKFCASAITLLILLTTAITSADEKPHRGGALGPEIPNHPQDTSTNRGAIPTRKLIIEPGYHDTLVAGQTTEVWCNDPKMPRCWMNPVNGMFKPMFGEQTLEGLCTESELDRCLKTINKLKANGMCY